MLLKSSMGLLGILCLLSGTHVESTSDGTYEVVYFDDFDGTELNADVWSTWNNVTHCSPCELSLYMDKNVEVKDGYLTITSIRETVMGPNNEQFDFTSGWVTAKDKLSHYLGKFEVFAKLPSQQATGAWPAHWLMPQSDQCWPTGGEIDIMEATVPPYVDSKPPYHIYGSYRWGTECTEDKQILPGAAYPLVNETGIDYSADFHTFAVEWTATELIFSVDGEVYETKNNTEVIFPTAPMYYILDRTETTPQWDV